MNTKHITKKQKNAIATVCVLSVLLFGLRNVQAQVMSSTNYKIQSDSVNSGGILSNSGSYKLEDTVGEIGTGDSTSASYKLRAGYQAMQLSYIALSSITDVTMSPSIGGVSGGTSNGSADFTVTTDDSAGYQATFKASSSPAMVSPGGDSIADYTPTAPGTPDFAFAIASDVAEFGFSPEGSHIVSKFKDNGSACATGSSDTPNACWYGLSTAAETVAQSASPNHPGGTQTTLKFRVMSGSGHIQNVGVYTATTTITALPL